MKQFLLNIGSGIRKHFAKTDKLLLFLVVALSAFSCVLQYSLACTNSTSYTMNSFQRHVIFTVAGIIVGIIISMFDYHFLAKLWKVFVPVVLILMILLLFTPLGTARDGGNSEASDVAWLTIAGIQFQPSELLKIAFILTFSYHLYNVRDNLNKLTTLALVVLHAVVPIGIMAYSKDNGTTLIFILIFVCIIFASNLSWKYILAGCSLAPIAGVIYLKFILDTYINVRFNFSQEYIIANKADQTYQQYWGQLTLGSGELTGKGLFSDSLITTTPELHNDFIFAHVGQTVGFIGCCVLIFWILFICAKIILTARGASDPLGSYICVGVFTIIFMQSVINIGMVLCVLPVIGITLPLVSAGGTSIITTYMALGLALSVYKHTKKESLF